MFFGFDSEERIPKLYLRALLYSTGKRGHVVQSMHARVRRGESAQTFSFWAHGEVRLSPGGGIVVDDGGVATNHHFLVPVADKSFTFTAAKYEIEVFADVVGQQGPARLCAICVELGEAEATALLDRSNGVMFDWGPDSQRYTSHVKGDRVNLRREVIKMLEGAREE